MESYDGGCIPHLSLVTAVEVIIRQSRALAPRQIYNHCCNSCRQRLIGSDRSGMESLQTNVSLHLVSYTIIKLLHKPKSEQYHGAHPLLLVSFTSHYSQSLSSRKMTQSAQQTSNHLLKYLRIFGDGRFIYEDGHKLFVS